MKKLIVITFRVLQPARLLLTFILAVGFTICNHQSQAQSLQWAFGIGDTASDLGLSLDIDASNNVYVAGSFMGAVDFDPGGGITTLTAAGSDDIFLAKYDASGNLKWARSAGGKYGDQGYSVTLDDFGSIYITGYFQDTTYFNSGNDSLISNGGADIFLAKYDTTGNFIWAKGFGGTAAPDDVGTYVTTDASGNVYVAGMFTDTADFDPGPGSDTLISNGTDGMFIVKFDPAGNHKWAFSIDGKSNGPTNNYGLWGFIADTSGNLYITGVYDGTKDFDPVGTANLTAVDSSDIFLAKYDSSGKYIWAQSMGGTDVDKGYSLSQDLYGNLYISGEFTGTANFNPAGTDTLVSNGTDLFVAKYDSSGNYLWAFNLDSVEGLDVGDYIINDNSGNLYLSGGFMGTADFDPSGGTTTLTSAGSDDIFIAKYDSAGNFVSVVGMGGTGFDYALGLGIDALGNVLLTGAMQATVDFDPGVDTAFVTSAGDFDMFMAKYSTVPPPSARAFIPDTNFRAFLNANYLTFMDGSGDSLIIDSAATFTGALNCSSQGITDLTGVEYFVNITWLRCEFNQLTVLPDLSANTALVYLWCYDNQLTSLPDLTNNTALQQLRCQNNQLTVLPDLSANTALLWLYCNNNQLTVLPDLTNNTVLQRFYCNKNQLTALPDLTINAALEVLYFENNKLDFSDARELRIADAISTLLLYTYSPQNPFGNAGTFNLNVGDTLILSIANQDSALSYQWFRGTDTITGAIDTVLTIPNITLTDSGAYTCRSYGTALLNPSPMTNGPGITEFVSEPFTVNISPMPPQSSSQWAIGLGDTLTDFGISIDIDGSGNMYVTGLSWGAISFPGDTISGAFLAKYDDSGNYLWAINVTNNLEVIYRVKTDGFGFVYVLGHFNDFATTIYFNSGSDSLTTNGGSDLFIAKYDTSGNFIRVIGIGGPSDDIGLWISTDTWGNVYVTGSFQDTVDFTGSGIDTIVSADSTDIFVAKYDSSGNYKWAISLKGANGPDESYSLEPDAAGNIYITGYFNGTVDFDPGVDTANLTAVDSTDMFIAKYDSAGNYVWAKNVGGSGNDKATKITLDNYGNLYITGYFAGAVDFDPGIGTDTLISSKAVDHFLARYDTSGLYHWAISFDSLTHLFDIGNFLANDDAGNVYLTGGLSGTIDFDKGNGTNILTTAGSDDIFIAKYDSSGNHISAISVGGSGSDFGLGMAIDASNNIYLTGAFSATVDFDPGAGTNILTSTGGFDLFIAKYNLSMSMLVLTASASVVSNVSCNGGQDGKAAITATGGTPPYTYLWNDPMAQTTDTALSLLAGPYSVIVYDSLGAFDTAFVTITEPTAIIVVFTGINNISCFGGGNGTVTAIPSGGSTPYSYLWSGGQTSQAPVNLLAGTHIVTVTDSIGCTGADSITLTQPALPLTFVVTTTPDSGACTGTTTSTPSGGTTPYAYNVTNSLPNDSVITGLCADSTYILEVWDLNACTAYDTILMVAVAANVSISLTSTNASCNGICDGSSTASASGGSPPYTYLWDDPSVQTDSVATGLCAGGYSVIVTDSAGSSDTAFVTITEPPAITTSITGTDVTSCGGSDGSANLTISGGVSPYAFIWSSGDTTEDVSNLAPGTYTVTIIDSSGCVGNDAVTIGGFAAITLSMSSSTTSCNGVCDGSATVAVSAGTPPYIYLWNDPKVNTNTTADSLCAGSYEVVVTDAALCQSIGTVTVAEPSAIALVMSTIDATCGNADGIASVIASGGTAPYDYSWSSGDTTEVDSALAAGINYVIVTDTSGCIAYGSAAVSNPTPTITVSSVTDVDCNADTDGAIDISVSGGVTPYTYLWSNGEITQDLSNLIGGIYDVVVNDAAGCTAAQNITVIGPPPLVSAVTVIDASCNGSDGSAVVSMGGGTVPYTYFWSTSGTDSSETGLIAGIYLVNVFDVNGCFTSTSVVISNAGGPIVSVNSQTEVTCSNPLGGSINIDVTGGNIPYTYQWSNSDTTEDIGNLSDTTFNVTVTDASGCIGAASIQIGVEQPAIQPICIVSVDSATERNIVVWEKTPGPVSYNIYKEGTAAGIYFLLGSVPYDSLSVYLDLTANPQQRSWRYKVVAVDSCGTESGLSQLHKTMHLASNLGLGGVINLIWDPYEGFTYGTYYIYRGTDTSPLDSLTAIPSNLNSWTDLTPPGGQVYYEVFAVHPSGCTATKQKNWNSSKSNTSAIASSVMAMVANTSITNATQGNCDGIASVTVSGGTAPYTYLWNDSLNQTTASATGLCAGNYSVLITDASGDTLSATAAVGTSIGIGNPQLGTEIKIYPNPNTGKFIIDFGGIPETNTVLEVRNMIGQLILKEAINDAEHSMDLSAHGRGIYYVKIQNRVEITVVKVIKQ